MRRLFSRSGLKILAFVVVCVPLGVLASPTWGQPDRTRLIQPEAISQDEVLEGWISIFDGFSLFGWKTGCQADWNVEEGEIRVTGGERGLLRTTTEFDDFELVLEFKAGAETNSGIFLRTSPDPTDVLSDCYEINIAPAAQHAYSTGALVGRVKTDLRVAPDQWHHLRVLADGPKIKVWIDDQRAVEWIDKQPVLRGYIGLQLNSGPVAFRNIALKPINQNSLFDGSDLSQWKQDQALASRFEVNDSGELRITNGSGQLESRSTLRDFVLSLNCKTNAGGLNSGVFFRCIEGERMNGYESQIQNQFQPGDRTNPVDCGTGGIFRRVNARWVNADDQAWFAKTIIATGPHIGVWVNGIQVTDWTDKREPDPNPRKGYRADAGSIILQGHDPTTDILFRRIQARELAPRR